MSSIEWDGSRSAAGTKLPRRAAPFLGLYALGIALAFSVGWRMVIPYSFYQLLANEHLADRLLESLLYLHAQPPMLNLVLGLALKLEKGLGPPPETTLLALNLLVGGGIVVALVALCGLLHLACWKRWLIMVLVLLNPAFYYYLLGLFYPVYETLCLLLLAVFLGRFVVTESARSFSGVAIVASVLVYTRSLFHFSWALLFLLGAAVLGSRLGTPTRGLVPRFLMIFSLATLVILAWPLKNYFLFESFSFSSWQGLNLSQGLPVEQGEWSPLFRYGVAPASELVRASAGDHVPRRFRGVPVLAEPLKRDGVPNWNHYLMLEHSRDLGKRALATIAEKPVLVLHKAAESYAHSYTMSASRNPRTGDLAERSPSRLARLWQRAFEVIVFQFFGSNSRTDGISGFAVVFPTVIILTVARLLRDRRRDPVATAIVCFLLFSILWVLAMVLCVDGLEGNRMRLSTQPFIFICGVWAIRGWRLPGRALQSLRLGTPPSSQE